MLDPTATAEKPAALSTPQPAQPKSVCAECGTRYQKARPQQQFCSTAHKIAFQNRQNVEGRAIVALVKAWRAGRNLGKGPEAAAERETARQVLSELCSIVDGFNMADRDAGRPNPLHYAKGLLRAGRYIDRQRSR